MSGKLQRVIAAGIALGSLLCVPVGARAMTTLTVSHTANPGDVNHFTSIQDAILHIKNVRLTTLNPDSFTILVQADAANPYVGPILIDDTNTGTNGMKNVTIVGTSTKDTIVSSGGGAATAIAVSGSNVSNITIRRLFFNSGTGISINANGVTVTNSIFMVGTANTAISVGSTSNTSIVNNTFYQNRTAILAGSNVVIDNNIFSLVTTAVSGSETPSSVLYNDFDPKTSAGIPITQIDPTNIPNTTVTTSAPLFVDPANRDFHLQSGSAALNNGDPNLPTPGTGTLQMGAYGGTNAEPAIPQVTGVTIGDPTPSNSTFSFPLSWDASSSGTVAQYVVRYGLTSGLGSQLTVPASGSGDRVSATLSGITPVITGSETLSPPTITGITVKAGALGVSWQPSSDATPNTVYTVYYNTSSPANGSGSQSVAAGSATSATVSGLTNGTTYFVAVQASEGNTLYVTVAAADASDSNEGPASDLVSKPFGSTVTSALSDEMTASPEASVAYPILKGEGCFIATAAYGFYSAWQVQALRDFRDRYLLTNAPGRAFVAWYYHYGPIGAHYLNQHPALKPLVRVLLFPLVVAGIFLTATSAPTKVAVLALSLLAITVLFRRRLAVRFGGAR